MASILRLRVDDRFRYVDTDLPLEPLISKRTTSSTRLVNLSAPIVVAESGLTFAAEGGQDDHPSDANGVTTNCATFI